MTRPKAQTHLERLGFFDEDLKSPGHDAVMLWLDDNLTELIPELFSDWSAEWPSEQLKIYKDKEEYFRQHIEYGSSSDREEYTAKLKLLETFPKVPPFPRPRHRVISKSWEEPIYNRARYDQADTRFEIGFIDLFVELAEPKLDVTRNGWEIKPEPTFLGFEAKVTIPSLGELLRQLAVYRKGITKHGQQAEKLFVVSPDNRYAAKIREQGFGFIGDDPKSQEPPNYIEKVWAAATAAGENSK